MSGDEIIIVMRRQQEQAKFEAINFKRAVVGTGGAGRCGALVVSSCTGMTRDCTQYQAGQTDFERKITRMY
jgi:hypothetical protein